MTFLLAHLSDPHIGPLPPIPLAHLLNKRLTGAMNWHSSRANIHNMDVLERIIADINAQKPDHIALTGDLVNIGYPPEFPQAARLLAPLGEADQVSFIPGNHDAYVGESLGAMARAFRPFMLGDNGAGSASDGPFPPFPYLRVRGKIALIGANSGVPTPPFFANGRLGKAQLARLGHLLDETRQAGLFRVVMIHHPPLRKGARFGRGLDDALHFEHLIAQHGAELVLHGHNHRFSQMETRGPDGLVPVIGVASASAVPGTAHHLAEYNLITIRPENKQLYIERRGITSRTSDVEKIGDVNIGFG